jgi:uncharacterized protein
LVRRNGTTRFGSIVSGNNLGQNNLASPRTGRSRRAKVLLKKDFTIQRRQKLAPPKLLTGKERRLLNPSHGLVKLFERNMDRLISRFLYPHLSAIWNPYTWLIERRFRVAETTVSPGGWPQGLPPLRVLLLSDIHCGIFLKPETLAEVVKFLMQLEPDLVVVTGDIVTGHSREVRPFLPALAPLSRAPQGAWFCFGNHDYFGGDPEEIRQELQGVGILTLKNQSVRLSHGTGSFVLGGIDDLILGKPDWSRMMSELGAPHILLAHNPDHFYNAAGRGVALVLSGHTHGGQIRLPHGRPIIRQSRFCLDEGVYSFQSSLLVVSRGLGSILLPWRWGADPEAVMIEVLSEK